MDISGRRFHCGATHCAAGPFTLEEVARHVVDCPQARADAFVEVRVLVAKTEVQSDLEDGTVPTVTSFSELHDFVDANEYGGLCEDDCFEEVRRLEEASNRNIVEEIQNAVDRWIKGGALVRTTA